MEKLKKQMTEIISCAMSPEPKFIDNKERTQQQS